MTISPSDADPGGKPNPRKSSPDNAVTDALKLNGRKVIVAIVAFGSMCLSIIFVLDTPNDLAALIYACDLVVSIENLLFALAGAIGVKSKILLTRNCLCFNGSNDLKSYWVKKKK